MTSRLSLLRTSRITLLLSIHAVLVLITSGCGSNTSKPDSDFRSRTPGELFVAETVLEAGQTPWALAVADFNADGAVDVSIADILGGTVTMYLNDDDTSLFTPGIEDWALDTILADTTGFLPRVLVATDVNADGLPDIVVGLNEADTLGTYDRIVVLINDGTKFTPSLDTTITGREISDLFVGGVDGSDQSIRIIGGSTIPGVPLLDLSRPARTSSTTRTVRATEDETAPLFVEGTTPAHGDTNVSTSTAITVWFTKPLLETSQISDVPKLASEWLYATGTTETGTREIDMALAIKPRTQPDRTFIRYVIYPERPLLPREEVDLLFLADSLNGIHTSSGTATNKIVYILQESERVSFLTEDMKVVATSPELDETGVPLDQSIQIAFNGPPDAGSIEPSAISITGRDDREIGYTTSYDDSLMTVSLHPAVEYRPYEEIKVTVTNALLDTLGRRTLENHTFSFVATGPRVIGTVPTNGSSGSAQAMQVLFNAEMAPPPLSSASVVGSRSGHHEVAGLDTVPGNARILSLTTDGGFFAGESVTVTMTLDVISTEGFKLAKPHVWTFTTQPTNSSDLHVETPKFTLTQASGTITGGEYMAGGGSIVLGDTSGMLTLLARGTDGWDTTGVVDVSRPGRRVLRSGDLDADGLVDLIELFPDSNIVRVYRKVGSAAQDRADYLVGLQPSDVAICDLDGDGSLDLATVNTATNDVSVLMNNGDGTFAEEAYYAVGNYPKGIVAADLDLDGDIDLITSNSGDGTITLLMNLTSSSDIPNR
jgi:hypothetical protein